MYATVACSEVNPVFTSLMHDMFCDSLVAGLCYLWVMHASASFLAHQHPPR